MKDDEKTGANEAANGADCVLDLDGADDWRYEDEWPCFDDAVRAGSPDVDVMDLAREGIDGLCEPVCRGVRRRAGRAAGRGRGRGGRKAREAEAARGSEQRARRERPSSPRRSSWERRGYEIVEHNWRCPAGEADLNSAR